MACFLKSSPVPRIPRYSLLVPFSGDRLYIVSMVGSASFLAHIRYARNSKHEYSGNWHPLCLSFSLLSPTLSFFMSCFSAWTSRTSSLLLYHSFNILSRQTLNILVALRSATIFFLLVLVLPLALSYDFERRRYQRKSKEGSNSKTRVSRETREGKKRESRNPAPPVSRINITDSDHIPVEDIDIIAFPAGGSGGQGQRRQGPGKEWLEGFLQALRALERRRQDIASAQQAVDNSGLASNEQWQQWRQRLGTEWMNDRDNQRQAITQNMMYTPTMQTLIATRHQNNMLVALLKRVDKLVQQIRVLEAATPAKNMLGIEDDQLRTWASILIEAVQALQPDFNQYLSGTILNQELQETHKDNLRALYDPYRQVLQGWIAAAKVRHLDTEDMFLSLTGLRNDALEQHEPCPQADTEECRLKFQVAHLQSGTTRLNIKEHSYANLVEGISIMETI